MNVLGIIKDAFLFPSRNTGRFAIYLLLSVLMVGFIIGGILTNLLGVINSENYLLGGMYFIIALLIGFVMAGYQIRVIKSGIDMEEEIPVFQLFDNFMTGFDYIVVLIAYFIIPALIVLVVAQGTNLFENAMTVGHECIMQLFNVYVMGNSADVALNAIYHTFINFADSFAVTLTVALIVFVIFSFFQFMAEARLANTGSLISALNIFESGKDLKKIGVGKVILVVVLVFLIISIIEIILLTIFNFHPFLITIIYIVLTPYFALSTQRALGLLYSDIA